MTCKEYSRKLRELMDWCEDCRYTILGKISGSGDVSVIAFDLTSALTYSPNAEGKISRTPEYPQKWGAGFGMSVENHENDPLVKRFAEDTELILSSAPALNVQDSRNGNTEDDYGQEL